MRAERSVIAHDWAEVIRRAKELDAAAFDEIVDAYAGRLYGFFHRMLGRREEAEDLVQEVFIRVVKSIPEYREAGRFEAWLFRIAGNLVRDRLRRATAGDAVNVVDPQTEINDHPRGSAKGVGDGLERREDINRLQPLLARLPSVEREAVLLRHYGELSFAEIAEYTAAPLGTVLARVHRGLAKLREWMESPT